MMTKQAVPTTQPRLLTKGLRGGEEMPKRGKAERERSWPTPAVGTRLRPSLRDHPFILPLEHGASLLISPIMLPRYS